MKGICPTKVAFLAGVILLSSCGSIWAKIGDTKKNSDAMNGKRRTLLSVYILGNTGDPPPEALPLGECAGDCDTDDECADDMICFQRGSNEAVPGCDRGEEDDSQTDYCILDPSGPTEPPTPTSKPTDEPTAKPTRDPTGKPSGVPSEASSLAPSEASSLAPSEAPSDGAPVRPFGTIEYVGNEGTFYSKYPMGVCQGDCDDDNDCAEGLYCHQRSSQEAVPYCWGGTSEPSTADFCAWDGVSPKPEPTPPIPDGYFRLKLYWEEGYTWQNETFEREWCMMYNFDGYPGTGLCWQGEKDVRCDQEKVYVGKCIDDAQQWFTFVNVTSSNNVEEKLIMTGDGQRCFQRKDREIWLENCNPDNGQQRWFALNGDYSGSKFEISQLGYTTQCVSNDHHPKSGEVIETHHLCKLHDGETCDPNSEFGDSICRIGRVCQADTMNGETSYTCASEGDSYCSVDSDCESDEYYCASSLSIKRASLCTLRLELREKCVDNFDCKSNKCLQTWQGDDSYCEASTATRGIDTLCNSHSECIVGQDMYCIHEGHCGPPNEETGACEEDDHCSGSLECNKMTHTCDSQGPEVLS